VSLRKKGGETRSRWTVVREVMQSTTSTRTFLHALPSIGEEPGCQMRSGSMNRRPARRRFRAGRYEARPRAVSESGRNRPRH